MAAESRYIFLTHVISVGNSGFHFSDIKKPSHIPYWNIFFVARPLNVVGVVLMIADSKVYVDKKTANILQLPLPPGHSKPYKHKTFCKNRLDVQFLKTLIGFQFVRQSNRREDRFRRRVIDCVMRCNNGGFNIKEDLCFVDSILREVGVDLLIDSFGRLFVDAITAKRLRISLPPKNAKKHRQNKVSNCGEPIRIKRKSSNEPNLLTSKKPRIDNSKPIEPKDLMLYRPYSSLTTCVKFRVDLDDTICRLLRVRCQDYGILHPDNTIYLPSFFLLNMKEVTSEADFKRMYKKLKTRWHPDKRGGESEMYEWLTSSFYIIDNTPTDEFQNSWSEFISFLQSFTARSHEENVRKLCYICMKLPL